MTALSNRLLTHSLETQQLAEAVKALAAESEHWKIVCMALLPKLDVRQLNYSERVMHSSALQKLRANGGAASCQPVSDDCGREMPAVGSISVEERPMTAEDAALFGIADETAAVC